MVELWPDAISAIVTMEEAPSQLQAWSDDPGRFKKILVRLD